MKPEKEKRKKGIDRFENEDTIQNQNLFWPQRWNSRSPERSSLHACGVFQFPGEHIMAKAPAFQFYVRDWLSDPQLRQATHSTKGIWIDLLCYMWIAPIQGELTGTLEGVARMIGAAETDLFNFFSEMKILGFGSLSGFDPKRYDVTACNDVSQKCNAIITIRNRRMYSSMNTRENGRLRQKKHREKQRSNAEITPPSASASASASANTETTTSLLGEKKRQNSELTQTVETGHLPLENDIYKKHPLLAKIHDCPELRGLTPEHWIRIKQSRSQHIDWKRAVKQLVDRATLEMEIRKPGVWVNAQLGYWEKDHADAIAARTRKWNEQESAIWDLVDMIRELEPQGKTVIMPGSKRTAKDILKDALTEFAEEWGAKTLKAARIRAKTSKKRPRNGDKR